MRGSRQVRVSRDRLRSSAEVETWIRLESGQGVGSITLNASYGKDWYPTTPNDVSPPTHGERLVDRGRGGGVLHYRQACPVDRQATRNVSGKLRQTRRGDSIRGSKAKLGSRRNAVPKVYTLFDPRQ